MPRKDKRNKEGGGFLSSISSAASRLGRFGSTAARVATPATSRLVPAARVATRVARAAPAVTRAAPTVSAVGEAAQKASLASRATSAANMASLGLTIGLPVYQIIEMEKQRKDQEAKDRADALRQAMYDEDYKEQKQNTKATEEKYAIDYAKDRKKKADDDALAEQRYTDAVKAQDEKDRLQAEADAKSYADLLEQQQTALALQAQMEAERTKRIEASVQAAISAALRGTTPSVPANAATPSNPRPNVPVKAPVAPTTNKAVRGYGKHIRTMKDLELDLAKLGYSL